ncbi:hypothetical protein ASPCADRAFT_8843 [Aspergillus carbonarius ITEM 5010]|uniref:GED domain-containing protein n=1 Tax=Aspergillus carbonarius (strain ITEM 5010) TaxID=602072 RepID=A0A1R3RDL1_ASPC5|nr:hypothetical protein ASPCADRAFT_8843 [Aspergillus carbonarius ITEM 5010]
MVRRHFSTTALEALCTQEHLELIDHIDTLRLQGISHYISLPQIIVCGDQSSGKSSVLDAISGVSFPVRSNLCTRFPTEVVLRKAAQTGVTVSIVPHRSRSNAEQVKLSGFHEELDSFEGLHHLIEKAKAAMGMHAQGKAFFNDLLRVEISGPDRPHLTIVDLPGLIHSETQQQSANDVSLVQDVVKSYMREPRSIILAVVSAKNDFANQIVLRLAREADPSGTRTVGVITKPDTLVQGSESESQFLLLAKNQEVKFTLGWHVLKNMDTERESSSLSTRNREESEFLSKGAWADLPRSHVGIDTLRTRLSKLLLEQIVAELPGLIKEVKTKMDDCQQQLDGLGQPRTTINEQRSYLLHISQSFQNIVRAGVDGAYNDPFFERVDSVDQYPKRIRGVVQNMNEKFARDISEYGHYRHTSDSPNNKEDSTGEAQTVVTRQEYIQHVELLLRESRGRELPGTFNPIVVNDLFQEQSQLWQNIAESHLHNVWAATNAFIIAVIRAVSDAATTVSLLQEVTVPAFDDRFQAMKQKLTEVLERYRSGHPITYSREFTETLLKDRRERLKAVFSDGLEDFIEQQHRYSSSYLDSEDVGPILNKIFEFNEVDPARFVAAEALDSSLAYYKVALQRFIDCVAIDVVETTLMQHLSNILSPVVIDNMSDTQVSRIAEEMAGNRYLRNQILTKLEVLRKGSDICRKFINVPKPAEASRDVQDAKDVHGVLLRSRPPTKQLTSQEVGQDLRSGIPFQNTLDRPSESPTHVAPLFNFSRREVYSKGNQTKNL